MQHTDERNSQEHLRWLWDPSKESLSLRAMARGVCLFVGILYPFVGVASRWSDPEFSDPLWVRAFVTGSILAVGLALLRWSPWAGQLQRICRALVYLITAHTLLMLYHNAVNSTSVIWMYVAVVSAIASSPVALSTHRLIVGYLGGVVTLCFAIVVATDTRTKEGAVFLVGLINIVGISYLMFVMYTSVIRSLRDSQDTLRQNQEQLRGVLNALPDFVLRISKGRVLEVRAGWHDGVLAAQLRQCEDVAIEDLPTPLGAGIEQCLRRTLGGKDYDAIEVVVPVPSGMRHIEIRTAPGGNDDVIATLRDITRERNLRARLLLEDRQAAVGTLAAGVAHEINNPLSYVISNLEVSIQQLEDGQSDGDLLEVLRDAQDGATRVQAIVAALKGATRPATSGAASCQPIHVVRTALQILRNQIEHRAIVTVRGDDDSWASIGEGPLLQIALNLVVNAIQSFSDAPAGVNQIVVVVEAAGDRVQLVVRDNGCGISETDLPRVLEPFYTTKAVGEGTGLGLYVCERTLHDVGGTLSVHSVLGQGTTIVVGLPLLGSAPLAFPPAEFASDDSVRASVLVIDDEEQVARAVKRGLRRHEVTCVTDVEDALRVCRDQHFDVIFCDLMMRNCTGMDFYASVDVALRSRVVFMTGGAFTAEATSFLASVSNPCIHKPFSLQDLRRRVEEHVQRR